MARHCVSKFLYGGLTYKIRGALFNVYNGLGFGHKEIVYKRALAQEFDKGAPKLDIRRRIWTTEYQRESAKNQR